MKINSCRFECVTASPEDAPRASGPDLVFIGRSNVGKSSLINRLLGTKGLARTSSRPGRTRAAHFYRVNERFYFIDLPGYGYAAVSLALRNSWKDLVEGLLERRKRRILLALLVVDARHGLTALDRTMRDWLLDQEMPFLVAATKADKLSGNGRAKASRTIAADLAGKVEAILVSAQSDLGIRELWRRLDDVLVPELASAGESRG